MNEVTVLPRTRILALRELPPPPGLFLAVVAALYEARLRRARMQVRMFMAGLVFSVGLVLVNVYAVLGELRGSSIVDYGRLMFSDSDVVFAGLKDFLWGILETLPAASMLLGVLLLFFVLGTVAFAQASYKVRHESLHRQPVH